MSIPQVLPVSISEDSMVNSMSTVVVPPLITYHHCPHPTLVIDDYHHALDLVSIRGLPPHSKPIVLQKSICSTRNANPYYILLSYHRLSSSPYAFLSFLSCIPIPNFLIQEGGML